MHIKYLTWEVCQPADDLREDNPGSEYKRIQFPIWADIEAALERLDGYVYPKIRLSEDPYKIPVLSIIGGPDVYTVVLQRGDDMGWTDEFQYINPFRFSRFERGPYREFGAGFYTYSIEEGFLTEDITMMKAIAKHFAETGAWYPKAAFLITACDEDGEYHEFF